MTRPLFLALVAVLASACGPDGTTLAGGDAEDAADTRRDTAEPRVVCTDRVRYDDPAWSPACQTAELGFDAAGREIRLSLRTADGTPFYESVREWDASGRLLLQHDDEDGDGRAETERSWTFDALGHVVGSTFQSEREEAAPLNGATEYSYDGSGRPIREERDRSADGTLDEVVEWTWTEGEPTVVDVAHDTDLDGVPEWSWRYTLREGRWLTLLESVRDGRVEAVARYQADEHGRLVRYESDIDADGVAEDLATYQRNAEGRPLRADYIDGLTGETYEYVTFEYDAEARLVRRVYVAPDPTYFAGIIEFDYGGDGRLARGTLYDPTGAEVWRSWTIERGCPGDRFPAVARYPWSEFLRWYTEEDYDLEFPSGWWLEPGAM